MKRFTLLFVAIMCMITRGFAQATFAPVVNYPISQTVDHLATGDFNHDGKTDIVVASSFPDYQLLLYYQNPLSGVLDTPVVSINYPPQYPGVRAIAGGDLNHDGRDDIAISYNDTIGIYYQTITGTLNPITTFGCTAGEVAVIKIADVDMDGLNDLVAVPYNTSADVIVYYGVSGGGFTQVNYHTTITGTYLDDLRIGKIGSDTLNSLLRMSGESYGGPITQLRIRRNRTLDATITRTITATEVMWGVEVGNFSDTVHNQIAATYGGNMPFAHLATWLHPDVALIADSVMPVSDVPQPLATGHLGCAPTEQIVILHGGWDKVSIVDMLHGITTHTVPCPNNALHDAVAVADVNGDGKPDIVAANSYAGLSVLLNTTPTADDTTMPVTHTTVYDTVITGTIGTKVMDTTLITDGFVVTTDSMTIKILGINTIAAADSGRLIYNGCDGDTISYISYLHTRDTIGTGTSRDTTHVITVDTVIKTAVATLTGASVKMYPNPFTKGITVEMPGQFTATLYNVVGETIIAKEGENAVTLNESLLPAGVYIVVVEDASRHVVCRSPVVKR